jgi:uncharacterized Zn finger protein (UPF0148 family)
MTLIVHCDKCGAVLYEGEQLKPPYEIIGRHDGRCPNCARRLATIPKSFDVRPTRPPQRNNN